MDFGNEELQAAWGGLSGDVFVKWPLGELNDSSIVLESVGPNSIVLGKVSMYLYLKAKHGEKLVTLSRHSVEGLWTRSSESNIVFGKQTIALFWEAG